MSLTLKDILAEYLEVQKRMLKKDFFNSSQ